MQRMSTQVDRLLDNPNFADPRDPKFNHIREHDFPSLLREAIRIEVSEQKGDWSIPTAQDVREAMTSKGLKVSSNEDSLVQEENIKTEEGPQESNPQPQPKPTVEEGFHGVQKSQNQNQNPTVEIKPQQKTLMNPFANTPFPNEGLMIDGSPPKQTLVRKEKPAHFQDEWTAPRKPKNLVPKGARIVMGGGKKNDNKS